MPAPSRPQLLALARIRAAGALDWIDGFGAAIDVWDPPLTVKEPTARRLAEQGLIVPGDESTWTVSSAGQSLLEQHPEISEEAARDDLARNPARAHDFAILTGRHGFTLKVYGDTPRDLADQIADDLTGALLQLHEAGAGAFAREYAEMLAGRPSAIATAAYATMTRFQHVTPLPTLQLRCTFGVKQ